MRRLVVVLLSFSFVFFGFVNAFALEREYFDWEEINAVGKEIVRILKSNDVVIYKVSTWENAAAADICIMPYENKGKNVRRALEEIRTEYGKYLHQINIYYPGENIRYTIGLDNDVTEQANILKKAVVPTGIGLAAAAGIAAAVFRRRKKHES